MDYKDLVVAIPNKMYTEDGEDITPKYYWDDAACDTGCEQRVETLYIKDDEELIENMKEELKNSFFVPINDSEVHKEAVNHPDHYNAGKYETIDIIRDQLTEEEFTGFCLGNAIKYISRCQHKGKMVEDIRKAIWYLNEIIEN